MRLGAADLLCCEWVCRCAVSVYSCSIRCATVLLGCIHRQAPHRDRTLTRGGRGRRRKWSGGVICNDKPNQWGSLVVMPDLQMPLHTSNNGDWLKLAPSVTYDVRYT